MPAPSRGHVLRVAVADRAVTFAVECHEPANADCRTVTGGCLVSEQADGGGDVFAEYHDGRVAEPLTDGMRIVADWSTADDCYEWRGYLEDNAGGVS